jgi:hypothetical protein
MNVGTFEYWDGECADTGGRPAYYNSVTDTFLYYHSPYNLWFLNVGCGMTVGVWSGGGAGWYPFVDTAAIWQCSTEGGVFVNRIVYIECSFYDGQPLPCSPGKYEASGEAPNGDCANSCPPHLPTSHPGSTALSSCMTHGANFLLISSATDRLMEFNSDESDFSLAFEGGGLRSPWGVACVSEILCLVGNSDGGNVVAVNLRGEAMGVFAQVGNPYGLLHIKHQNLLAVASWSGHGNIFLFDLADLNLEQPLQVSHPSPVPHTTHIFQYLTPHPQISDAVQTIVMSASDGEPNYMTLGEKTSELLITTRGGLVLRRCIGTGCKAQVRNSVMMQYGPLHHLNGIIVLDETYIVVDSQNEKVYECPLTSVGIYMSSCEVFAYKPQGTAWDPTNLLVDPAKRLVYVADYSNSDVLVFSFDRNFLGSLATSRGALVQPRAMAQRPGIYAPLSSSLPPSSLPTAGERIEAPLVFRDATNALVSDDHPASAHDLALEVSATGYITGTNFTTTIAGEIL